MDAKSRKLMFFIGCIPLRFFLVWLASYTASPWFSLVIGIMGVGMIIRAILRDTGKVPMKGFGGGDVYWNSYVHGVLYLLFAALHYRHVRYAWTVLLFDVLIGLGTAINHYYL